MLVLTGVLPRTALDDHVEATATALFVAAGDDPERCRRSVRQGWRTFAALSPSADQQGWEWVEGRPCGSTGC